MRRLAAVLAWLALVLACSTGVWAVIRTAGEEVTTSPTLPTTTLGDLAPTPGDDATSVAPSPRPTRGPRTGGPSPESRPSAPAATIPPPVPPGSSVTPAPELTPSSASAASPHKSPTPTAQPSPRQDATASGRTWQGTAGSVTTSCQGASISFSGAQPNAGWRVEVGNRGPEDVEVQFQQGEDNGEVEVHARCSGGSPRYTVH